MNNLLKKLAAAAAAAALCFAAAGCGGGLRPGEGPGGDDIGITEEVDEARTQLYVCNFKGGYGDEWIYTLKKRFEEVYKDVVFEEGRKGVQVLVDNQKTIGTGMIGTIANSRNEVFFSESVFYYDFVNQKLMADITDVVSGEDSDLAEFGDTGTIEDKLSEQQKSYYKTTEGKYYGIPHYSAYSGIMYDVDLFDREGWYLAADQSRNDGFIVKKDDPRSLGPDGKTGVIDGVDYTADDGLPATYDEFFRLCDYIVSSGNTPVIWTGQHHDTYLKRILQALATDYEGAEQILLNYNFRGTAENLVQSVSGGTVTKRQPVPIENSNGYEMYSSAGRYYALKFLERLIGNASYWHHLGFNNTESHIDAQDNFLLSTKENKYIGMLLEGIWWENEANDTFVQMANSDADMARMKRRIGFMPYPKATQAEVGEKMTLMDTHYSLGFVNANITEPFRLDLAKKFLKFANTQQSLAEFTVITNTPKSLEYTVSEEDQAKMSYYGRSLLRAKEISDVVYPYSTNRLYLNNQTKFEFLESFSATIDGTAYSDVAGAMHNYGKTAEEFFEGIVSKNDKAAWDAAYSSYWK